MPLEEADLRNAQDRVLRMFNDTVSTIREIQRNSDWLFNRTSEEIVAAIEECLRDFVDSPGQYQVHPEKAVYQATVAEFESAGFYGAQLVVKERQVMQANEVVRRSLSFKLRSIFRSPFKKWIDIINNFLASFFKATGVGEAVKELKDVLAGELDD